MNISFTSFTHTRRKVSGSSLISAGIRQLGRSFAAPARSGTQNISPLLKPGIGLAPDTATISTKSGKAPTAEYERIAERNRDYSEAIKSIFTLKDKSEGKSFSKDGKIHLRLPSELLSSSVYVGTLAGKNSKLDAAHISNIQKLVIQKSKSEPPVRKALIREGYKMGLGIE